MMISETDPVTEQLLSVYLAALDSRCSSHTVMEESLPEGAAVDRRKSATIGTDRTGATIHSHGRLSNGL